MSLNRPYQEMNLPEAFIRQSRTAMGDRLYGLLEEGLKQPPPVSVRLNRRKTSGRAIKDTLRDDAVAWCPDGYYLTGRPGFTFDPLLHAGCYYVQEASSMFIDHVVRQYVRQPATALDLCAAPGGKSTALRAALPEGSLLVANEPVRQRAQILSENLQKWGHPDVVVTNNLPADFSRLRLSFDVILTDVPCSGEGMFRKDAGAISEWSEQNVLRCQSLQREIVSDAWRCLRPGGLLIYSTCTFNLHENEENIQWLRETWGAELLPVDIHDDWMITPSLLPELVAPVYRFIPGVSRGEGLFMAVMRKPQSDHDTTPRQKHTERSKPRRSSRNDHSSILQWMAHPDLYTLQESGTENRAIPTWWLEQYEQLTKLNVLHAGIRLGTRRGKDIVPATTLALSTELCQDAFESYDLDYPQALSYLRNEAIVLPPGVARGFVLMCYQGMPLGFVKNIGSRANNLYPQEWKIRSSHYPETDHEILETLKTEI